jgi:hypothetical protein
MYPDHFNLLNLTEKLMERIKGLRLCPDRFTDKEYHINTCLERMELVFCEVEAGINDLSEAR